MTTRPEQLSISLDDGNSVIGLLYRPAKAAPSGVTLILRHGAGAGQLHPFMQLFESCYRSVIEAARKHKKLKGNRVVIGGKSMGGRIASQVAALDCGG
ncbi:MAG: alpha/beta family hydrolase, partial [Pyrinomonadaceae bacterium]